MLFHRFSEYFFLVKSTSLLQPSQFFFFPFQLPFRCWYVKQNGKNQHPALLPWYAQTVGQSYWWRYWKAWEWLYQVIYSFHHSQEDRLLHYLWHSSSSALRECYDIIDPEHLTDLTMHIQSTEEKAEEDCHGLPSWDQNLYYLRSKANFRISGNCTNPLKRNLFLKRTHTDSRVCASHRVCEMSRKRCTLRAMQ